MTTHLVTFATADYSQSMAKCVLSAEKCGIQSRVLFGPFSLPPDMFERCDGQRGFGWWQWKPWVVNAAMGQGNDNDVIIYADSGIEFIAPVSHIISRMDQDIFLFGNNWEHAHWCKGDVAYTCWPDNYGGEAGSYANVWGRYGKQCQASVIFFRVSDYSRAFVAEWLKWCLFEGGRLIDDSPSHYHNHFEFREHRHDQAILTTMAYREGIKLHAWPAVYNRFLGREFVYSREGYSESDNYPSLFHHHRLRNSEFEVLGIKV